VSGKVDLYLLSKAARYWRLKQKSRAIREAGTARQALLPLATVSLWSHVSHTKIQSPRVVAPENPAPTNLLIQTPPCSQNISIEKYERATIRRTIFGCVVHLEHGVKRMYLRLFAWLCSWNAHVTCVRARRGVWASLILENTPQEKQDLTRKKYMLPRPSRAAPGTESRQTPSPLLITCNKRSLK
jgi:hypothetical protein